MRKDWLLELRAHACDSVLKAYVFAYLSATTPAILGLVIALLRRTKTRHEVLQRLLTTVKNAAALDRLPACAAILVFGSTFTPWIFLTYLSTFTSASKSNLSKLKSDSTFRWVGSFASAYVAFQLLNKRPARPLPSSSYYPVGLAEATRGEDGQTSMQRPRKRSSVSLSFSEAYRAKTIPPLAGRTLDLTTFGTIHAIVILASTALYHHRTTQPYTFTSKAARTKVEKYVAPSAFIASSFVIMWNWFFSPDRLPKSYNTWIKSAAQIDARLIEALRQVRFGTYVYGQDTGRRELLGSMARELGFGADFGDPAKTAPIPCELYHSGTGKNCEWHAISRFARAWYFALRMYLPLNLVMLYRRKSASRQTGRALLDASQSAAFLGSFVALFYYGVCLGRTRIGPKLFGTDNQARMMIDGGLCVGVGAFACGWSILLEKAGRRPELALFVAPRALSTILPRRYDRKVS